MIKSGRRVDAERTFSGAGVQFTDDGPDLKHKAGQRHLGAAVGSAEFAAAYLDEKVASWTKQVVWRGVRVRTYARDRAIFQSYFEHSGGRSLGCRRKWLLGRKIWAYIPRCSCFQSSCSIQPQHPAPVMLPQAWKHKKESLWAAHSWGGACVLHSPDLLCLWRNGQRGLHFLQASSVPPGGEKRSTIQWHHELVEMTCTLMLFVFVFFCFFYR